MFTFLAMLLGGAYIWKKYSNGSWGWRCKDCGYDGGYHLINCKNLKIRK